MPFGSLSAVCGFDGYWTAPSGSCVSTPSLISVCPDRILANISQTMIVQGMFPSNVPLSCVLSGAGSILFYDANYLSSTTIACISLIWPNTTLNQVVQLHVTVGNSFGIQSGLSITILGACEVTKAGSVPGANGCECPPGTSDNGASCIPCENGYYQPNFGQTLCVACGDNQDTNFVIGSITESTCVCKASNYRNPTNGKCMPCVAGMYCPGNNIIDILPGYWQASNTSISVIPCRGGTNSVYWDNCEFFFAVWIGVYGSIVSQCATRAVSMFNSVIPVSSALHKD